MRAGVSAVIKTCRECREDTSEPIPVGLEPMVSCGGRVIYLCPPCLSDLGVVPLSQHPEGSLGRVLYAEPAPEPGDGEPAPEALAADRGAPALSCCRSGGVV
ncbi:hypothetical protein [Streptomyces sp. NPDC055189]